jgi:hypothetical protein
VVLPVVDLDPVQFGRLSASSALCGLFGDLPIDPELARAFLSFFGLKVHFLFERPRDLGLQGFQMTNFTRV